MLSPAFTPKPKACAYAKCGREFMPTRPMQNVCGALCAGRLVREQAADRKAQAQQERKRDKARREKLKTIRQLIAAAQTEFNAYIRERDKDQPCICCGEPLGAGDVGGAYDCGHYRSTGSAAHLRFDERNAHAQRKQCNRWGAGRAVDYRVGLVARIGLAAVEALEADNAVRKWTREELVQLRATYKTKLKELRKEAE